MTKTPSVLGGAMIIAGTAIGAGMLAIPIATSGMWYSLAVITMIITWFCMYTSGLFILEANQHYPLGANTDTISKDVLPIGIRFLNGASLVFVLYTLTYAYITSGSPFLQDNLKTINIDVDHSIAALIFTIVLGGFVTLSTKMVDRVTTILLAAMVITFSLALPNLIHGVKIVNILNTATTENNHYSHYIYLGLTSLVASFGFMEMYLV